MAFEYLAQYTTFNSIADMDKSVEDHMAAHYYDLTESERVIVFKLASHSLEYPGACHLKASTIAAALEISIKTVYRAIKKLESLGIIKKRNDCKKQRWTRCKYLYHFALQCLTVNVRPSKCCKVL